MKIKHLWIAAAMVAGSIGFSACGTTAAECVDHFGGGGAAGGPSVEDCLAVIDATVVDGKTDVVVTDAARDGDALLDAPNDTNEATFTLGGTVSGYAGTGLSLENGTEVLPVAKGATAFTFATKFANAAAYAVKIKTQPTDPSQTCTLTGDTGSVANANVTSVKVTCVTNTYSITANVNGLINSGLVLQNNGGDDLSVSANLDGGVNTSATFATKIASGSAYAVTVKTHPNDQTCTIAGATGTVIAGPITTVTVTCVNKRYMVGGMVSGLAGTGLVVQNNLGDNATVNANGTYSFATPLETNQNYSVTVLTQPTSLWQTCTVANPTGTIAGADVTNANITCVTNTYNVGAQVSGLTGSGLVLQNNGSDNLNAAGGANTFATKIASGAIYAVTVVQQPTNPSQTCTVSNAAGTVAGTDVAATVSCTTNQYTVGGAVSGLAGSGLVLQNNGGADITMNADGTFTFPAQNSGTTYSVAVATQPTNLSQTCVVTNGSGTVTAGNVTNVGVSCSTNSYSIGVSVSGVAGAGLVLRNNGGNDLSVAANGSFQFTSPIISGGTYAVTVLTNPSSPTQTCIVSNGTGTVTNANIVNVSVACTTNSYSVSGTIAGISGRSVVLRNNGGNDLTVSSDGVFTFTNSVQSGNPYDVTVFTQPSTGAACVVSSGSGTVTSSNVTTVAVVCRLIDLTPSTGMLYETEATYWQSKYYAVTFSSALPVSGIDVKANLASTDTITGYIWDSTTTAVVATGSTVNGANIAQFYRSNISFTPIIGRTYMVGVYFSNGNTVFSRKDGPSYPFTVNGISVTGHWSNSGHQYPTTSNSWAPFIRVYQ